MKKVKRPSYSKWRWHIDEVFVKINGETHCLWRAIDHEGIIIDCYVSKRRDTREAKHFLKKMVKKYGLPTQIVSDKLRSYGAALRELNMPYLQFTKQYVNNQVENSHLHFRRREKMMNKFRSMRSLQKFSSFQSDFLNHFNHQRHLENRQHLSNYAMPRLISGNRFAWGEMGSNWRLRTVQFSLTRPCRGRPRRSIYNPIAE